MSSGDDLFAKYPSVTSELQNLGLDDDFVKEILELTDGKMVEQKRRQNPEVQEKETKLHKALESLINSENEYVSNLNIIVKNYIHPLRSGVVKIKTETLLTITSNIEVLAGIHTDLLRKLGKAKQNFPNMSIGDIFEEFIPSMKVYTQYLNHFSATVRAIEVEKARSKAFAQFLLSCEDVTFIPLQILLSMPLNRIPHYRGALLRILESMARDGPDYCKLSNVTTSLTELQDFVNESKSQADKTDRVFAVESKIIGRDYLLNDQNREFIDEGAMLFDEDKRKKDVYIFLFNDIILVTKKVATKEQYKFKQSFSIQYASLDSELMTIKFTRQKESLSLIAANIDEKVRWMEAFRGALLAMEKTRVFGASLSELMERESPIALMPSSFICLISHLEKNAPQLPGLFRISGSSNLINSVISKFDRGIKVDLSQIDSHAVAGVLKQFLRTLKEPIIPYSMFDSLLECFEADDKVTSLKQCLADLPPVNMHCLKRLMKFLLKVTSYSAVNKMTTSNLAIVIGPNLAREANPSPFGEITITTKVSPLTEIMMTDYDSVFPKDGPRLFSKAMPRSRVTLSSSATGGLLGNKRKPILSKMNTSDAIPVTAVKPPLPRVPSRPVPPPRRKDPATPIDAPRALSPPPVLSPPPPAVITDTSPSSVGATACSRCAEDLGVEYIELCDKLWHPECFLCNLCSSDLSNGFFKYQGNPICKPCKQATKQQSP